MYQARRLLAALSCAVGVLFLSVSATASNSYQCGSPVCGEAITNSYAERLNGAWKASATTDSQRQKMLEIININTNSGKSDWKTIAESYFSWRSGSQYTLIEPKPSDIDPDQGKNEMFEKNRKMIELAILDKLIDPESARFNWPFDGINGAWKPDLFKRKIEGWVICGIVNSKNRMGGYSGSSYFSAVVKDEGISYLSIDGIDSTVNEFLCNKAALPFNRVKPKKD